MLTRASTWPLFFWYGELLIFKICHIIYSILLLAWIQKYHLYIAGVARFVWFISFKLKPEDVSVPLPFESWLFCPFSLPVQAAGKSTNWGTFIFPSRHLQNLMNGLSVSLPSYGNILKRPALHLTSVLMGCLLLLAVPSEEKPPDCLQVAICRISVISLFML